MRVLFEVDGLFEGERVRDNAALVIDGDEIVWVGDRRDAPASPPGERSDAVRAPGRFVLPGFINCHCHLTLNGEPNFAAEVRQPDALAALKAFANARSALRAGVTTVRDLSANGTMAIELAQAIDRGLIEGPRVIACGRGITTTGGHGLEVGRIADDADEVRKGVREQIHAGAKVIKLFSTGGVLGEGAPPDVSQYTPEETAAAVSEAHKAGIRITTHAHAAGGIRVAVEAGVDSIEHATMLDAATVRLLKERDVAIVPTLLVVDSLLAQADKLEPMIVERLRAVAARHRESVRLAHRAGVRIATGTDAGAPFTRHDAFARELALLAECGLSPTEALASATRVAADVIGREKSGRLEPGCSADLLFVDADPIRDPSALSAPAGVYVRGAAI